MKGAGKKPGKYPGLEARFFGAQKNHERNPAAIAKKPARRINHEGKIDQNTQKANLKKTPRKGDGKNHLRTHPQKGEIKKTQKGRFARLEWAYVVFWKKHPKKGPRYFRGSDPGLEARKKPGGFYGIQTCRGNLKKTPMSQQKVFFAMGIKTSRHTWETSF
jgi:hypothetical protein